MPKIILAGVDYEAPAEVCNAFAGLSERLDSLTEVQAERDVLQVRLDEATTLVATIPTKVAEAVKARNTLVAMASKVLAKETVAKMDSMEDSDIRKAVIMARFPDVKLDGKDELYVNTCYDLAVNTKGLSAIAKQRLDSASALHGAAGEQRTDGEEVIFVDSRDGMIQAQKNAYKRDVK